MDQDKDEVIFELIDDFTSGGKLYYHEESIWMINPETKEWIFEFTKSGKLWYSYLVFTNIFKWISMEYPDFNPYITKWVERILQNEVKDTYYLRPCFGGVVERILQNEVKDTSVWGFPVPRSVERILQNEVKDTCLPDAPSHRGVERILQNEVKDTFVDFDNSFKRLKESFKMRLRTPVNPRT